MPIRLDSACLLESIFLRDLDWCCQMLVQGCLALKDGVEGKEGVQPVVRRSVEVVNAGLFPDRGAAVGHQGTWD